MVMASAFRRLRPDWELIEATGADEALGAIEPRPGRHRIDRFQHAGLDGLELVARIPQRAGRCRSRSFCQPAGRNRRPHAGAQGRLSPSPQRRDPWCFPNGRGAAPAESEAMSVDVLELTPIERDAFAEIANMGPPRGREPASDAGRAGAARCRRCVEPRDHEGTRARRQQLQAGCGPAGLRGSVFRARAVDLPRSAEPSSWSAPSSGPISRWKM